MRFFSVLLTLIMCFCIFSGCASKEVPPVNEISLSLKELSSDAVNWASLDKTSIKTYFGMSNENIKAFSGYINSSEERFDMIAVFEYEDKHTRQAVLDSIVSLTQQMSDNYKLANVSEASKITTPSVAEIDNVIIFCVMDSRSEINDYLENELNAKIIS